VLPEPSPTGWVNDGNVIPSSAPTGRAIRAHLVRTPRSPYRAPSAALQAAIGAHPILPSQGVALGSGRAALWASELESDCHSQNRSRLQPERSCLYDIDFVAEANRSRFSNTSPYCNAAKHLQPPPRLAVASIATAPLSYISLSLNWRRFNVSWSHPLRARSGVLSKNWEKEVGPRLPHKHPPIAAVARLLLRHSSP